MNSYLYIGMYYESRKELDLVNKWVGSAISENSIKVDSDSASLNSSSDEEYLKIKHKKFEDITGKFDTNHTEVYFT